MIKAYGYKSGKHYGDFIDIRSAKDATREADENIAFCEGGKPTLVWVKQIDALINFNLEEI